MLDSSRFRQELRQAGLTARAIDAAWPEWWSTEAESSPSAAAELRFTLARRLGLAPASLFDGQPTFVWRDEAKFKRLRTTDESEKDVLTSFGMALGRMLINATSPEAPPQVRDALAIRRAILASSEFVSLREVLALCWSLGIPVAHAAVLPLRRKRMHAMTVSLAGRHAIILGRVSRYESQLAYVVAHELGHVLLGHLTDAAALVELGDPLTTVRGGGDQEEVAADRFALSLLTGSAEPVVESSMAAYSATQLAQAAIAASSREHVNPGVLALCLGHSTGRWAETFGALKIIPPGERPLPEVVNLAAMQQLNTARIPHESALYVLRVLGLGQ